MTEAVMVGFDRSAVEARFSPEDAVWTPVKLREAFSTVEWRSPDAALPGQVLRLTDQLADLVARVDGTEVRVEGDTGRVTDDAVVLPEFEAVQEYVRTAIRMGLSSPSLRTYLDRMGFDVSAFEPLTREFDTHGDLPPERTRELRLAFADRLAEEVRANRPVSAD